MGGNNKFIDKFSNVAMRVGGQIHLKALRDTFATIMPLYILAGVAVLINNVVLPFILKGNALVNAQYWGTVITNGTLNISGLLVAPIVAYMLSQSKRFENPLAAAIIALSSLIVMMPNVLEVTPVGAEKGVQVSGILGFSNIGTYLVPSRVHPGEFYGLPQSPQLFKQLLMCSGFDRYYQIAKCFRDEDLRADRQPEFTQIDMELSFVDVDDVIDVNERLLKKIFKEVLDIDVQLPMLRMTYKEAMDRFGSDKPDMRFGMELTNVSDTVAGCDFMVFKGALENGGSVRGLNAKGLGDLGRKKIDGFVDYAKDFGAKGLAYIQLKSDGTVKSSFAKFMKEEEMDALIKAMDGQAGDLLLFAADKDKVVFDVLGNLRLHIAKQYDMIDKSQYKFLWVTEFPLLEWSDEQNRYTAMHHPFTMPFEEDLEFIDERPGDVRAKAYDIVLNGTELGGGSIRIHQDDIQEKMFEALGFTKEDAYNRFGFLLDAFKFGVPPHAGLAYGLDRLVMWLTGEDSIRDVIAFPKVKDASCLMTQAPGPVDTLQLEELGIELSTPEEE